MRSKPIIILAVIVIAVLAIYAFSGMGGNFGRQDDSKTYPPHAVQQ